MASSISQGLVLTTAMVFSTTVLYLAFSWQKPIPNSDSPHSTNKRILRSCLYSEEKKKERKKNKKRVKFAKNVMVILMVNEEARGVNEEIKEEQGRENRASIRNCGNEIPEENRGRGMPANRIALYNGMLRDRGHRIACCH